jgi:branched-chain amino acid transport system substrate-binding protein
MPPPVPQPRIVLTPPEGVTARIPVGLLLPLSGDAAVLGKSLLDAAQLALFEVAGNKFELLPRDTKGTEEGARAAAQSALDAGAQLLLGPVFAANARIAASIARPRGITQITFTNDRTVAGDGTFVIGLLPGQRIERVVSYAATRDIGRFAALIPEGRFGDLVATDFQTSVARAGGELVRIARYAPTTDSVTAAIKQLGDYDARRSALLAQRQALKDAGDAASLRELRRLVKRETLGDVAFDAVLLLETGPSLSAVAPLLPYYEIDTRKVRVLGIQDWSPLALRREAAIAGAWYAGPDPVAWAAFAQRFHGVYGKDPHPLASLAYDATALAAILAESGDGSFAHARFSVAHGFAGSTGLFRLAPDGLVEHQFAVMEVQPDGVRVAAPALQTFGEIVSGGESPSMTLPSMTLPSMTLPSMTTPVTEAPPGDASAAPVAPRAVGVVVTPSAPPARH